MAATKRLLGLLTLSVSLSAGAGVQSAAPGKQVAAVEAIVALADELDQPGLANKARQLVKEYDSCDISRVFQLRKHGGAGIGSAVQAGHADSIQSLVVRWSGAHPPTKEELVAHRKDLLKTARVLKVMAELAPLRLALVVPKSDLKRVEAMHKVTKDFKAVTHELHDVIAKTDPMATRQAAVHLNQTCAACHTVAGN